MVPEYGADVLEALGAKSRDAWSRAFDSAFWYQPLLKAAHRIQRNRVVSIVTLRVGTEPQEIFSNICPQRLLIARLLDRLQTAEPAMIVIDKYFSPKACANDDPGTERLRTSISRANIPIVMGIETLDRERLSAQRPLTREESKALEDAPLILEPHLDFANSVGPIHYGLLRLNRDNRKIPLWWRVHETREDLSRRAPPKMVKTLALVAAERHDKNLSSVPGLIDLRERQVHPYTGFLEAFPHRDPRSKDGIPTFSALELICGEDSQPNSDWRKCAPKGDHVAELRNRIVIIGNTADERDLHPSVIGVVPGVLLQANYIESLLDDRNYLAPVRPLWSVAVNVLAAGLIGFLFVAHSRSRKWSLSPAIAVLAGVMIVLFLGLLSYSVALVRGYYLTIWFPGLYVLGMWGHALLDKRGTLAGAAVNDTARANEMAVASEGAAEGQDRAHDKDLCQKSKGVNANGGRA